MINDTSRIHIAFLGPKGSYSHIAAKKYANYHFNKITEYSCQNFSDILHVVENNQVDYGILPIENSNSGLINEVCDLLLTTHLILIGDITIPIQHRILVNNYNSSLKQIQTIYSHPQPIQQCSNFLKKFPHWKIILCESSSIAIKKVAYLNQPNIAALGSTQGGIIYGLHPLLLSPYIISNYPLNSTRFIILKNENLLFTNTTAILEKIMLIISIDTKLNKLYSILKILQFYKIKINFLRLCCSLLPNNTTNSIILEITAHFHHTYTQQALIKIYNIAYSLKILGCYSTIAYQPYQQYT
ncbi:prephenate dehydratase [Candidatus Blochmanniella floridana]|uniref:prephenate dehydratase n=1 Tax=Blochmanniella floridana TaxID=203907 RepID=Q7VQF5_BLOFL|nr:prephenate dehydratase [Candidatus Blochmannia floridanus]